MAEVLRKSTPFHFPTTEGYYMAVNVLGGEIWRSLVGNVTAAETLDHAVQMGAPTSSIVPPSQPGNLRIEARVPHEYRVLGVTWRRLFFLGIIPLQAGLQLPRVFSDHMVLQRDKPIPVWGWADAGTTVTVEFNGATQTATTAPNGHWQLSLPAMKASSAPLVMTLHDNGQTATVSDILVGDVWLCAGQSNMDFPLGGANGGNEAAVAAGQLAQIRLLHVVAPASGIPADDIPNAWTPCTTATVANFSAVAFFFGQAVSEKIGVPIGLIQSAWGGTPIQPWTPREGFALDDKLKGDLPRSRPGRQGIPRLAGGKTSRPGSLGRSDQARAGQRHRRPARHARAAGRSPRSRSFQSEQGHGHFQFPDSSLIPFAIRGVIWYQGDPITATPSTPIACAR